mgnify:CR=1 FL=1
MSTNPPPKEEPLAQEHKAAFEKLQENCYQNLHRPMVIKAIDDQEHIWYVCQECLDAYVKEHPEIKGKIIAFRR